MNTFKPFFLIILMLVLGMFYVTTANKTNFYTQNTLRGSGKLHFQNNKVNKLKTEIADILASKAASYRMVKIPDKDMPAEESNDNVQQMDIIKLASNK